MTSITIQLTPEETEALCSFLAARAPLWNITAHEMGVDDPAALPAKLAAGYAKAMKDTYKTYGAR